MRAIWGVGIVGAAVIACSGGGSNTNIGAIDAGASTGSALEGDQCDAARPCSAGLECVPGGRCGVPGKVYLACEKSTSGIGQLEVFNCVCAEEPPFNAATPETKAKYAERYTFPCESTSPKSKNTEEVTECCKKNSQCSCTTSWWICDGSATTCSCTWSTQKAVSAMSCTKAIGREHCCSFISKSKQDFERCTCSTESCDPKFYKEVDTCDRPNQPRCDTGAQSVASCR